MRLFAILLLLLAPQLDARIKRSAAAKQAFAREHHCPATGLPKAHCPGYVIDHVIPLACGGADHKSNMQWQDTKAGKAKDRWERKDCSIWFRR